MNVYIRTFKFYDVLEVMAAYILVKVWLRRKSKNPTIAGWVALESYLQDGNGPRETIPKDLAALKSMF